MLFNSPTFIVFFAVVFCLYWLLRERHRQNVLLLLASYVFYGAWSWKFLLLLMLSTAVDFACGLLVARAPKQKKYLFLVASITVNLVILGTFKYAGFFIQEAAEAIRWLGFEPHLTTLKIVLPIGISFYTFQSISYVVDVYRGKLPATRNPLDYALYVAFFPQLVAGPIERATHLLPQFTRERVWRAAAFESGLQLMVWGLFKKVAIADNLAPYVDAVYSDPTSYSGVGLLTGTVFFAFQIYCDFSGYSDTARGVARTLGFDLISNFEQPYFSKTPVEFWRRWHISLSQWFQDYLYFPLAMRYMRKGGWASKYKAHIISMGLIGFWHGANWTFVVFGLYWGFVIAGYLFLADRAAERDDGSRPAGAGLPPALRSALSIAGMFVIACIGWVFFRSQTLTEAWYLLTHVLSTQGQPTVLRPDIVGAGTLWLLIIALWVAEWLYLHRPAVLEIANGGQWRRLIWRHVMVVGIIFSYVVAQEGKVQPFIYFQF
jgi:D-alanyl-lipoteichoic acid acyltransferase DltB (MBOAT superfamily)